MAKTKFFRVAVEGATTDGRVIERSWIADMAAGYNPATYTARVNCEHVRGYSPQPPFNAYGTITAVKAEEIDLELAGKTEKRLALFAQFDVNEQLKAINDAGQKLFSSVEIAPNFAATGKAGLVGLAVTDNPASLGTEMLKFTAAKPMIDAFKTKPDSVIGESIEFSVEWEAAPPADATTGALTAIANFFTNLTKGGDKPAETAATPPPPPANDNFALTQAMEGLRLMNDGLTALGRKLDDLKVGDLRTDLASLKTKLEASEAPGFSRQLATGGTGGIATDC